MKEAIWSLHKTFSGICYQNVEEMLTLTVSRKFMMNIDLKTSAKIRLIHAKKI